MYRFSGRKHYYPLDGCRTRGRLKGKPMLFRCSTVRPREGEKRVFSAFSTRYSDNRGESRLAQGRSRCSDRFLAKEHHAVPMAGSMVRSRGNFSSRKSLVFARGKLTTRRTVHGDTSLLLFKRSFFPFI